MDNKLTYKQRAFINAYLTNGFNGTQAALSAGYSKRWARMIAHENLSKHYIQEAIKSILDEYGMSAAEVIARLSAHARADIGDIWDAGAGRINWSKARAYGLTSLIKRIRRKTIRIYRNDGTIIEKIEEYIELHDAQNALLLLTKHYNYAPESAASCVVFWHSEAIG
jgi:phage terminase small subunit